MHIFTYVLVSSIIYVLMKVFQSYRALKFFKINAPHLPVLEGQKLLIGHLHKYYHPRSWKIIDEAHEKHGKMFGFYHGLKPFVSTTDLDFIKKFIIDEPNDHINRPKPVSPSDIDEGSLIYAGNHQWRRLRKAYAPAFSKHKIMAPNVQEEMNDVVDRFVKSIEWRLDKAYEENGENFIILNVDDLFHRYSLALTFLCLFKQDNLIDLNADKDSWQQDIKACFTEQNIYPVMIACNALPILAPLTRLFMNYFHPHGSLVKNLKQFIKQQTNLFIDARNQSEASRKNFVGENGQKFDRDNFNLKDGSKFRRNLIDHVIEQYLAGAMSDLEYENSTYFLFLAANLTSADALAKLTYNLAKDTNVQDKLRDSVISEGIESNYLSWSINESMRLFPPAPIGCSRVIARDIESEAGVVPRDTSILTPAFTINRLKQYWGNDADEFRPDRWENTKNFHPLQYLTFGAGIRACPGKDFALREMHMLMEVLIRKYKFELAEKTTDIMQFQTPNFISLTSEHPTWVKISRC